MTTLPPPPRRKRKPKPKPVRTHEHVFYKICRHKETGEIWSINIHPEREGDLKVDLMPVWPDTNIVQITMAEYERLFIEEPKRKRMPLGTISVEGTEGIVTAEKEQKGSFFGFKIGVRVMKEGEK